MIFEHGSPKPKSKKAQKMPDQAELNLIRKCRNCDSSLISFTLDRIQLRACMKCGSLYASDWGLDEIQKRATEIEDFLDPEKRRKEMKSRLTQLSRKPVPSVSRLRQILAKLLNPYRG